MYSGKYKPKHSLRCCVSLYVFVEKQKEIRDTRYEYEVRDTRYKLRDTSYEIRGTRNEIQGKTYKIRNTIYDKEMIYEV